MTEIAILGFGVVGGGIAEALTENRSVIEQKLGERVKLTRILDLRDFPDSPFGAMVTHKFTDILNDGGISVVAETMGGSHPAYEYTKALLEAGKHVVTSNKEVVAIFGAELLQIAAAHGVRYLFEASVGGGVPIIRPMVNDLAPNEITAVDGILNGTTNYILTQMITRGVDFDTALREAQVRGYAEKNPTADVEGLDAARKIVILAGLAFGTLPDPAKIHCEGITEISATDVHAAAHFGYAVKLIAHAEKKGGQVLAMVSPRFVPFSSPLAHISDVFNGIMLHTDLTGDVMFYGRGAGKLPTASAVAADIFDIVAHRGEAVRAPAFRPASGADYADFAAYRCRSCFTFAGGESDAPALFAMFGKREFFAADGHISLIGEEMSEKEADAAARAVGLPFVSRIRLV